MKKALTAHVTWSPDDYFGCVPIVSHFGHEGSFYPSLGLIQFFESEMTHWQGVSDAEAINASIQNVRLLVIELAAVEDSNKVLALLGDRFQLGSFVGWAFVAPQISHFVLFSQTNAYRLDYQPDQP